MQKTQQSGGFATYAYVVGGGCGWCVVGGVVVVMVEGGGWGVGGWLQLAWNLTNLSMIQNNDVWSPETYTNDLINSTSAQTICNFISQFQVCPCWPSMLWPVHLLGYFRCGGVAWVAAFHITKNTTVSQRLILVDNTNGRDSVSKHQLHDCLLSP